MKFNLSSANQSVRLVFGYMAKAPVLFGVLIAMSIAAALTEGISVSLLVPILEVQGGSNQAFSSVPILKNIGWVFDGLDSVEKLKLAALLLGAAILVRGILLFLVQVASLVIPINIQRHLTMTGYEALMKVDIAYVNNHDVGDLTNAITSLPQRITIVLKYTANIITNSLILAIYTVLMVMLSWEMTLISIIVMGVLTFLLRYALAARVRALGQVTSQANAELNQTTFETMNGMKQIRLSGAEGSFIKRFEKSYWDLQLILRKTQILGAVPGTSMMTAVGLFISVLLFWGAAVHGSNSAQWTSQLLLFLFLLMRLLSPVTSITQAYTGILSNISALHETHAFLEEVKKRRQPNGSKIFKTLQHAITFDHVSFHYKEGDGHVLNDISTTIHKGEMVSIVGASGAGKSTLINILVRLYDPVGGRVLVDGVDMRAYDVASWRRGIGVVSQDIAIFNDTVANNIRFGAEDADMNDVRRAAKIAIADDFINAMENGYDTVLGDRGVRLSGGQQQRIAIARAILSDSDLLILDEGTSHLDSVTERAIQESIETLSQNRTILVVAHRLSTVRRADRIIVMDEGRIVEEGRHDELVALNGMYLNLLNHHSLDFVDDIKRAPRRVKLDE